MASAALAAGAFACGFDGEGTIDLDASPAPANEGGAGRGGDADASAMVEGGALPDGPTACALGDSGATGTLCSGKCVDTARDHAHCGGCGLPCLGSSACEGSCVEVARAIDTLRYEIPCTNNGDPFCTTGAPPPAQVVTLTGTAGRSYVLTLRVRGVVEQKTYTGKVAGSAQGTNAAFFIAGGVPANDFWNTFLVEISAPAKTVYLNSGTSNHQYVDLIDYRTRIVASAGATVTLDSASTDNNIVRNKDQAQGNAIVVPDIKPAPMAFDGQFIQLDVESVSLAP